MPSRDLVQDVFRNSRLALFKGEFDPARELFFPGFVEYLIGPQEVS